MSPTSGERGKTALILVDLQNDFLPGGALAVAHGDEVIPVANDVLERPFDLVVATRDFHPRGHLSFASSHAGKKPYDVIDLDGLTQVLWPDHCVQDTRGSQLAPSLATSRITRVFPKGTDRSIDSYSGFYDNGHRKSTGLGEWLKAEGAARVYVLGLATDYCVKFTALDARALGFETFLVEDGCRAVELSPGDGARAIDEMRRAGVRVVRLDQPT